MNSYNWLIDVTITSTIVAIIIALVRLVLKEKLTGKLKYYLWVIFLLRLMVVQIPESQISIYNFIPQKSAIQKQVNINNTTNVNNDKLENSILQKQEDKVEYSSSLSTVEDKLNIDNLFSKIYISMVIIFILIPVISYIVFVYRSKKKFEQVEIEYSKRLDRIKKRLKIRRKITLVYGDTAFIYGFFKIKLVIPKGISLDDLDAVLVHELMHYKYGDLLINWLLVILKAIYWFNPIVWIVFKQIRKDCELSCDERVIESKFVDKKSYATVLFKNTLKGNKYLVGTSSFSKGGSDIKRRIKMIQKFKKKSVIFATLGVVIFLGVGAVCLTDSVNVLGNDSNISINDKDKSKEEITKKTNDDNKDNYSENKQEKANSNTGAISKNIENKNKDENSKLKDTNLNLDESLNNSDSAERLNNTPSNSDVNLNDISTNVKNYILNGQGNKAEAEKLKWSNTFLEQVDFKTMYDNYLVGGGLANDVEDFAKYITLSSPIQSNWQELFEKDLYNIYGQSVIKIEHLGGDSYQAYINVDGKDVPYVVVSSRTGYFHG